jgi:2-methylcitrate dehydratase PrpD
MREARGWTSESALREIAAVRIETYGPGYEIVKEMNPATPYQAKFSIAYCVAATLLEGGAPLEAFGPERFGADGVRHRDVAALLDRTSVVVADDLTGKYPAAWPTRLTITLAGGGELRGASDYPVGNPGNPVSTAQLEAKLRALVAPRLGAEVAERALALVRGLESVNDVSSAFRSLMA